MKKPRYKWRPLVQVVPKPLTDELVADVAKKAGVSVELARADLLKEESVTTLWTNDIYQVQRRELGDSLVHLNIRRRDGGPVLRDWRHFQQIKNELLGAECEAVELYPAESRLVDTTNKYHLWGYADPTFRFPVGMRKRDVNYHEGATPGTRQRPL